MMITINIMIIISIITGVGDSVSAIVSDICGVWGDLVSTIICPISYLARGQHVKLSGSGVRGVRKHGHNLQSHYFRNQPL